jgi:hypothetical protein
MGYLHSGRALVVFFGLVLGSAPLRAQEEVVLEEDESDPSLDSSASEPATTTTTASQPSAPSAKAAERAAEHDGSLGFVERLPASAFPEWRVRGIAGGSLIGTMHGMPWPYYPKNGLPLSGSVWVDFGYETIERGDENQGDHEFLVNQSRGVVRASPTYTTGSWYVQAQAELVANGDQAQGQPINVSTDDLYLRTGEWKSWDVQVGRFEALEVYHFGLGMDQNTLERQGARDGQRGLPEVPGLSAFVYRQNGVGNLAGHVYPTEFLRFELLAQWGFDAASGLDGWGGRPAAVLDFGSLKLKGSVEYRKQFQTSSKLSKELKETRGGSAALQLVLAPYIELGGNFAMGLTDHWGSQNASDPNAELGDYDAAGSTTDTSYGGFINGRIVDGLVLGAGLNLITQTDQVSGEYKHLQGFAAVQYILNQRLAFKLVGGYAKADLDNGKPGVEPWANTMKSIRLRVAYGF